MNDKRDSKKSITRVDLESEGEWVRISQWFGDWKPSDPPALQTIEKADQKMMGIRHYCNRKDKVTSLLFTEHVMS